jgi:DNA sulfur modification protein DndB
MVTSSFEYVLPVIRGIQAGREYYVSMCPLRFIPKLFVSDQEKVPPQMRAARSLNRHRVSEIARYILDRPKDYVFSAITASVDADIIFEPMGTETESRKIGRLRVPMDARFTINDGEHRRAAFELALKENPALGYETIAVILFLDIGLKTSQQIFADLNRYGVRPDPSLCVLYDRRDERANVVRAVVREVEVFRKLTEMERSSLSMRSGKLFTLSDLYKATLALLAGCEEGEESQQVEASTPLSFNPERSRRVELAVRYWDGVSRCIPDWQQVLQKQVSAGEVRRDCVCGHVIALLGLGAVGARLLSVYPVGWEERLAGLAEIDWSRSNVDWQGRIVTKGGISQSRSSVSWMVAYLKGYLGLPLTVEEEGLEGVGVAVGRGK